VRVRTISSFHAPDTFRKLKNDRRDISALCKIAHMHKSRLRGFEKTSLGPVSSLRPPAHFSYWRCLPGHTLGGKVWRGNKLWDVSAWRVSTTFAEAAQPTAHPSWRGSVPLAEDHFGAIAEGRRCWVQRMEAQADKRPLQRKTVSDCSARRSAGWETRFASAVGVWPT
jgi:hypothetical protein